MSFCLGVKIKGGLIGIADTRITSGTERITAGKVSVHQHGKHSLFIMTSGLRSVRDKALTYFETVLEENPVLTRVHKVVNAFADQVRRVAAEDKPALNESGLDFNLNALVGGQLENDKDHKLYRIYPEGNWVEVGEATPFCIIGESGYGKPILERTLRYDSDMEIALQTGFLAFNATMACAVDVDYPIDIVAYRAGTYEIVQARYAKDELAKLSKKWAELLNRSVNSLPLGWMNKVLSKLPVPTAI